MSLQGPVEDQSCLVHRVQEAEDRVRGKGSDIDPQGHTSITHPDMPRVCSVSPGWFPRLPMQTLPLTTMGSKKGPRWSDTSFCVCFCTGLLNAFLHYVTMVQRWLHHGNLHVLHTHNFRPQIFMHQFHIPRRGADQSTQSPNTSFWVKCLLVFQMDVSFW